MLADQDHPIDDPHELVGVQADPRVVVVYRSHGVPWLLIPPLLILAGVGAIVIYRKSVPPPIHHRDLPAAAAISPINPPAAPIALAPANPETGPDNDVTPTQSTRFAVQEPAVAPSLDMRPPDQDVATRHGEVPETTPAEHPKRAAVGFDPEAAQVSHLDAEPLTPPVAVEVPDALKRPEAEARPEDPPAANDPPLNRATLIFLSKKQAEADRMAFHADLRRVLSDFGKRSGPEIQALCNRYGRATLPEIILEASRDLVGPSSRLSQAGRVQRLRRWGLPEAMVLDDIAEVEMNNQAMRGGPRTKAEVWVRAARILLSIPPSPTTPRPGAE